MSPRRNDDRPTYRRSGRVAWLRFLPAALLLLLLAIGMGVCWSLAYRGDWHIWLLTPFVLALPLAVAGYFVIALGHCRNRLVAGALGVAVAVVFHATYFHADLVRQQGPAALARLDLLPEFIAARMATDIGPFQIQFLPRGALNNWLFAATELLGVSLLVGGTTVYRSLRGYCESCRRWMRTIALRTRPGLSTRIANALEDRDWSAIPVAVGQPRFGQSAAWLEFEYCPGAQDPDRRCAPYLTLKEYPSALGEQARVLMYQGQLDADEMEALAGRVAALAFLSVTAPAAPPDGLAAGLPIHRHAGTVAAVEQLPSSAGGTSLDRMGVIEFLLALIPLAALLGGIGLAVWGAVRAPWADPNGSDRVGYLLLAGGTLSALVGGLVVWVNIDYLGMRYAHRRLLGFLAQRPDGLVAIDEPGAWFAEVVPRAQWHQTIPDKPADRGLLAIDRARGRLLFEGLKERYIIPVDAVLDCRVEPMMPHTGNWNFFAVVLTVRYPMGVPASVTGGRRDDEWEVPFLPRPTRFRRYNTAYRRALARDLRDEIEDMLDQAPRRKSS